MPDPQTAKSVIGSITLTRTIQIPLLVAAVLAIYTEGTTAFVNVQKAIEAKAVAGNASVKQNSEAVLAQQQALAMVQAARNAAERQKAEADKSEAEALKIEAEATTARNAARYAAAKTRADALTIKNEAELRKQKLIVAIATARNAARRQAAEADRIEAEVETKRSANAIIKGQVDVTDCSKPFRGGGMLDPNTSMRRLACGR